MSINFSAMVPATQLSGEDEEDTLLLRASLTEARGFLTSFDWCIAIRESYFGLGVGGIVAVFLFKLLPSSPEIDEFLWVVVGDLPSAYLVVDDCPTALDALASYVEEMQRWVDNVRQGRSIDDCIPVNVTPSPANADGLQTRLDFLRTKVIPRFQSFG